MTRPSPAMRVLVGLAALVATAMWGVVWAPQAAAHGSTVDPASRNYGCWERWGDRFQDETMATEDPMCWQAWRADPNAMWNWNGLLIDGINGAYESGIPDGQICSGGHTSGGRYAALDVPGNWYMTPIASSSNFTVELHDQALHGSDFLRVYVTGNGYDPKTEPLSWDDLTLHVETETIAPGSGSSRSGILSGVSNTVSVSAPGLTGHHVVLMVWKASHSDQTYYLCSDVDFGGPGGVAGGAAAAPATPPTTAAPAAPSSTMAAAAAQGARAPASTGSTTAVPGVIVESAGGLQPSTSPASASGSADDLVLSAGGESSGTPVVAAPGVLEGGAAPIAMVGGVEGGDGDGGGPADGSEAQALVAELVDPTPTGSGPPWLVLVLVGIVGTVLGALGAPWLMKQIPRLQALKAGG